jgi:hypothetical protein
VTRVAPSAGYYLAIAAATGTNTGANNDYLNCDFDVDGVLSGAAGFDTTAGNTVSGSSVTVAPTTQANQSSMARDGDRLAPAYALCGREALRREMFRAVLDPVQHLAFHDQ